MLCLVLVSVCFETHFHPMHIFPHTLMIHRTPQWFNMPFISFFLACSHSDANLVELGNGTVKEDDRVVLLEGGLSKSASVKFQNASIRTNLIRWIKATIEKILTSFIICLCKMLSFTILALSVLQVCNNGRFFFAWKSSNIKSYVRFFCLYDYWSNYHFFTSCPLINF